MWDARADRRTFRRCKPEWVQDLHLLLVGKYPQESIADYTRRIFAYVIQIPLFTAMEPVFRHATFVTAAEASWEYRHVPDLLALSVSIIKQLRDYIEHPLFKKSEDEQHDVELIAWRLEQDT